MVEKNLNHKGVAFIRAVNLPVEMVHAAAVRGNRKYRFLTEGAAYRLAALTL